MTALAGVSITGLAVFFTHESDPNWYGYLRGTGVQPRSAPSDGWAEAHALFADLLGITALIGGAWFVARIAYTGLRFVGVSLVLVLSALVTGSMIRFNVVKLEAKAFEEAGPGYLQVFSPKFEYLVNSRFELGAVAAPLLVLAHVLAIVVVVVGGWYALRKASRGVRQPSGNGPGGDRPRDELPPGRCRMLDRSA